MFCTQHMLCTWTHGHALHMDTRACFAPGHSLHTDCFAQQSWRQRQRQRSWTQVTTTRRWPGVPGGAPPPPGELQLPALAAISARGPCPQRRESPGYAAGGAWQQAAWSPGSLTPASWATWVRAGRRAVRARGCVTGITELGVWQKGEDSRSGLWETEEVHLMTLAL